MLLLLAAMSASALELPTILADGMVLQRGRDVPVWGWDEPGREVAVTFRGETRHVMADADGRWECRVPSGGAGGPFELVIAASAERVLHDVLVGEVWSPAVAQPVAVRHAWANYPQVNVVNSIGLPLATWRSDDW